MGDDSDVHRARGSSAARAAMSAASTGDRGARATRVPQTPGRRGAGTERRLNKRALNFYQCSLLEQETRGRCRRNERFASMASTSRVR